jgi:Crinkler effector protein N-terminal domain
VIHSVPPPSLPSGPQLDHHNLELNCFIFDEDPSQVFPVKITNTESVGTLMKAIKEEKKPALDHVDADPLTL